LRKTVFIYALVSSRDGFRLPWYVGQTVDCQHRIADHLRECQQFKTAQAFWTRQELADGFKVEYRIIEETDKDNAHAREEFWITKMSTVNKNLKNSTAGNNHSGREKHLARVQPIQREEMKAHGPWLADLLVEELV
jgi:hypothetical protein